MRRSVISFTAMGASTFSLVYLGVMNCEAMREDPKLAASHVKLVDMDRICGEMTLDSTNELRSKGIIIVDNFLTRGELAAAREDISKMMEGKVKYKWIVDANSDNSIRKDLTIWISEPQYEQNSNIGLGLLTALRHVRAIPDSLIRHGYDVSKEQSMGVPFSNQLACYDGDASHYIAHRLHY